MMKMISNPTEDPLGTPEEHANRIHLTQTKLESIIGDTYRLGWNAACKTAERKDLILEDEEEEEHEIAQSVARLKALEAGA